MNQPVIPIKIVSNSMSPIINISNVALVNTSVKDFRIGDIICYKRDRSNIIHRIYKKPNQHYLCKGDQSPTYDQPVHSSQIIGRCDLVIKNHLNIDLQKNLLTNIYKHTLLTTNHLNPYLTKSISQRFEPVLYTRIFSRPRQPPTPTEIHLLKHLLIHQSNHLHPTKLLNKTNPKRFLTLAITNKALHSLYPLIQCPHCTSRFSQSFIRKVLDHHRTQLSISLLYSDYIKVLGKLFTKNRIKAVLFKQDPLQTGGKKRLHSGLDLDLLTTHDQLTKTSKLLQKKAFTIKDQPQHEITLTHSQTKFNIDLHHLISIPRENQLQTFSSKNIDRLTKHIITNSHQQQNGLYLPTPEDYLIAKIVHYWTNDFLHGLRHLHQIANYTHQKQINWQKLYQTSSQHSLNDIIAFTLHLSNKTFAIKTPTKLNKYFPSTPRIRFLIPHYNLRKITNSIPVHHTWDGNHPSTKKLSQEILFSQLVISEQIPPHRLIRPRILIFLTPTIIQHFKKTTRYNT